MRRLILFGGVSAACPLHAHPGHLPLEHGLYHSVLSPYHFLPLLAFGAILFALGKIARGRVPSLLLKSSGAATLALGVTALVLAL